VSRAPISSASATRPTEARPARSRVVLCSMQCSAVSSSSVLRAAGRELTARCAGMVETRLQAGGRRVSCSGALAGAGAAAVRLCRGGSGILLWRVGAGSAREASAPQGRREGRVPAAPGESIT
jgi:hypothetical protein